MAKYRLNLSFDIDINVDEEEEISEEEMVKILQKLYKNDKIELLSTLRYYFEGEKKAYSLTIDKLPDTKDWKVLIMEKIIVQAIDCYRHDYWKVSLDLLDSLNIFDAISEYSYLGNGKDPLNEDGYAYLEIDSDCGIFDKAMKFYGKEYSLDFETLQEEYDDTYEDYRVWLEELEPWNTDTLEDKGFMWDTIPGDLAVALDDSDDEEDEDDYV